MTSTLPDLVVESASKFGPSPALAIRRGLRTEIWRYADLPIAMERAAGRLIEAGLEPGDRVLMLAPNTPELVVSMLAVWQARGILVPIDQHTPLDVIQRICDLAMPRLIITSQKMPELGATVMVTPAALASAEAGLSSVIPALPSHGDDSAPAAVGGDSFPPPADLAEIVYTSGTTGAPKGVMLTHSNILANVASALEALPIRAGTRGLSLLPLSHMLEQTVGLMAALRAGATVFYATSRRSSAVLASMQRHQIELLVCVPEVLQLILHGIEREVERRGQRSQWELLLRVADRLPISLRPRLFGPVHRRLGGHLRLFQCGGAPLAPQLWQTWEQLGVRVLEGYGATECAPIVTNNRFNARLAGSVGWPIRDVEVRLATDGEVLVRGPNVFHGYWRDPDATAAVLEDGWYRTGDVGTFGSQGQLQLLGRKKEMIVLPSGLNLFPHDIEVEIKRDPAVRDCVVIGKPRPDGGIEVHAVLVPSGDAEAALAAARQASTRLAPHQQIQGSSVWPDSDFPRTPTLKVKRVEVLEAISREAPPVPRPGPGSASDDSSARVAHLIAQATGRPVGEINPSMDLALDLGLDSLARIELAALLEEELGQALSDEEMAEQRTVADLLAALEHAGQSEPGDSVPAWPRTMPARLSRTILQEMILFPLIRRLYRPLQIHGPERLRLNRPHLIIANHTSHLDAATVLSLMTNRTRQHVVVAAAADYFFASTWRGALTAFVLNAFPFHRRGPVSASLAHCGDFVDQGYSILIFPEGTRSPDGQLQPFKQGIGLLARELGLPVLPIHLSGLFNILPKGRTWPRPGPAIITVGEPLKVDQRTSYAETTLLLESAVASLGARSATSALTP